MGCPVLNTRTAGVIGAVGAGASAVSAVVVALVITPASDISPEMWSYPWPAGAVAPVSLLYAVFHAMVLLGLWGLARFGAGRVGALIAVAGTAVLTVAEILSIPIADQHIDDSAPGLVGATFGLGTVISAIGLLIAGVAVVRALAWRGWRRWAPLGAGVWTAVMIALIDTPALPVAVGVYGLLLISVFVAVATVPLRVDSPLVLSRR